MGEMKKCTMCKELLPSTMEYFYRNKASKDGLQAFCKECAKKKSKENYEKGLSTKDISNVPVIYQQESNVESMDFDNIDDCSLITIENRDGILFTTSRDIAKRFKKQHKHVIEAIKEIETSVENPTHLFIMSDYLDSYKRKQKQYLLTRDGFSLLAMGFTGAKALEWKLKFIEAFNKMEEELKRQMVPTGKRLLALALIEANELIEGQENTIKEQIKIIKILKPKADFADTLRKCEDNTAVGEFAKSLCDGGFEIGQNRMFKWLRDKNILMKNNIPYQQYIVNGAFQVKKGVYIKGGVIKQSLTTVITPKGQFYLFKKLQADINSGELAI